MASAGAPGFAVPVLSIGTLLILLTEVPVSVGNFFILDARYSAEGRTKVVLFQERFLNRGVKTSFYVVKEHSQF